MMNRFETVTDTNSTHASVAERHPCYSTIDGLMEILVVERKVVYALIHKNTFPAIRIMSVGYRISRESFEMRMYGRQTASPDCRCCFDRLKQS